MIRPLEIIDLEKYFELVERNRKRLADFFTGTVSRTTNLTETKLFLEEMTNKRSNKQYYPFIILDRLTNQFISFIDLKNVDFTIPKSEIGFYTDEKFIGKGITTKAVNILVDYSFNHFNFKKVLLRTHATNKAAQTLAEKCGFEKEGEIRMDYKTSSGEIVDLIYYGKINPK